jgi:hypothetical protein
MIFKHSLKWNHLFKNFVKNILEKHYPLDDKKKRLKYFGQLQNGIPNGYGTMTWKDGHNYKGTKILKSMMHFTVS